MNYQEPAVDNFEDWKSFIDQVADNAARKVEELKASCLPDGVISDARFHQVMNDLWRDGADKLQARFPRQNKRTRQY